MSPGSAVYVSVSRDAVARDGGRSAFSVHADSRDDRGQREKKANES